MLALHGGVLAGVAEHSMFSRVFTLHFLLEHRMSAVRIGVANLHRYNRTFAYFFLSEEESLWNGLYFHTLMKIDISACTKQIDQ